MRSRGFAVVTLLIALLGAVPVMLNAQRSEATVARSNMTLTIEADSVKQTQSGRGTARVEGKRNVVLTAQIRFTDKTKGPVTLTGHSELLTFVTNTATGAAATLETVKGKAPTLTVVDSVQRTSTLTGRTITITQRPKSNGFDVVIDGQVKLTSALNATQITCQRLEATLDEKGALATMDGFGNIFYTAEKSDGKGMTERYSGSAALLQHRMRTDGTHTYLLDDKGVRPVMKVTMTDTSGNTPEISTYTLKGQEVIAYSSADGGSISAGTRAEIVGGAQ